MDMDGFSPLLQTPFRAMGGNRTCFPFTRYLTLFSLSIAWLVQSLSENMETKAHVKRWKFSCSWKDGSFLARKNVQEARNFVLELQVFPPRRKRNCACIESNSGYKGYGGHLSSVLQICVGNMHAWNLMPYISGNLIWSVHLERRHFLPPVWRNDLQKHWVRFKVKPRALGKPASGHTAGSKNLCMMSTSEG